MVAPTGMFFARGNQDALDQVKNLRLAKITSVDTEDMVVQIEFLEETTSKTRVPIPMPMAYPGGGIYTVPKAGAMVIVGMRSMQTPIILGYYPYNAFSPDSYFSLQRQVFGIPDQLSEGDILMRAASGFAKCAICNVISPTEAWSANVDPNTLAERCPNCNAPAYVNDEQGLIQKLNKLLLGMTMHMRSDGKLFIQGDNLLSRSNGDTQRLLKMIIDGVSGDITISDAGDWSITANGDLFESSKSRTIKVEGQSEEVADTRVVNTNQDVVESMVNKTVTAADTILHVAQTISIRALSAMNVKTPTLSEIVEGDHLYSAGSLVAVVDGERTFTVGGDDTEEITGSKTVEIGTTLSVTVVGGSTVAIGGNSVVEITGSETITAGGAYSISATGAITITSSAQTSVTGTTVVFNSGVLPVARKTDATLINSATDPAFITFLSDLQTILTDLQTSYNVHTHISAAPGVPTGPAVPLSTATVPTPPTTVDGIIDQGNTTVLA